MPLLLEVALPVPLRKVFTYASPNADGKSLVGALVKVPFRNQELIGVVVSLGEQSEVEPHRIKSVIGFLDNSTSIPAELMSLCTWCADYYLHPIGEVISAALPKRYREGKIHEATSVFIHTQEGKGLPESALKRAPKQQEIHRYLLSHLSLDVADLPANNFSKAALTSLQEKGLIKKSSVVLPAAAPPPEHVLLKETPKILSPEQRAALDQIRYHQYHCYLLQGATGSGKTELYLHAIARVLEGGEQALVLIPEIGLSPQTLFRFRSRFNVKIAELHSNVAEIERAKSWQAAMTGEAKIVIGTRLASLTPFKNLGLIIVDEEHDRSYKQQDGFKYSARDISVYRAHRQGIPIILGSATPSLESLLNSRTSRYQKLVLTSRPGGAYLPEIKTIDLRRQELIAGMSTETQQHLDETLARNEQALIFVNRRGYAPTLICHYCGWSAECNSCDVRMAVHAYPPRLLCHYCDRGKKVPSNCPRCASSSLQTAGHGTEQLEQTLVSRYPKTQVIRVDRDSTRGKNSMEEKLATGKSREPCIFVGTQMLAKGHHLPNLTLVIILDADQGLFSPDFRSLEQMGQLITQVAGRAGRESKPGKVLVQSHNPDHPYFNLLLNEGFLEFSEALLKQRRLANLPPFWHIAVFKAESKRADNSIGFLNQVRNILAKSCPPGSNSQLLGPHSATIEKVKDRYRYCLLIKSSSRAVLHGVLTGSMQEIDKLAMGKRTRWSLDVDSLEA